MKPPVLLFIIVCMIDTSNIVTNIFIIYAVRKLGKLGNISFWLIYCLSISDCFVGLSGLAADIFYALCYSGHDCRSLLYLKEVKNFFIANSFRLTTIIAIDRSIRMKYLNKYCNVMTKTKAYLMLISSAMLGLVQFFGNIFSQRIVFELVFVIFHFICITFSCILYTVTYCSIKQQAREVHSNLRCSDNTIIRDTNAQLNALDQSSHNKHGRSKESTCPEPWHASCFNRC